MKKHFLYLVLFTFTSLFSTNLSAQFAAGSYTIGTAGDYSTIAEVVTILNSNGINGDGDVTFDIKTGTYTDDPIDLFQPTGTSIDAKIIFKAQSGLSSDVVLRGTTAPIVVGEMSSYIKFSNLTVISDAVDSQGKCIMFDGYSDNIQFHDMIVSGRTDLSAIETSSNYSAVFLESIEGTSRITDIEFLNVTISGGTYGIYFLGDGQMDSGNINIEGCSINSQVASSIYLENINSPSIVDCTIESGPMAENIITFYVCDNTVIDRNYLISTALGAKTCINANSDGFQFTNNLLYSSGDNTERVDGIYFDSSNGSLRNNTIRITDGDQNGAAIYTDSNTASSNEFENNIIMTSGAGRVFDFRELGNVSTCNYNCFYSNHMFFASVSGIGGIDNLESWQSSGYGINSIISEVSFGDRYDLLTNATSPTVDAGNIETEIDGFPLDKNGQPRIYNDVRIDIGAMEVQADPITAYAGEDSNVCGETTLNATVPTNGTGSWSVEDGAGTFDNESSPNANVTDLEIGLNILRWSVTDGSATAFDDVIIMNISPYVEAGDDQNYVGAEPQTSIQLSASPLGGGETGMWTTQSSATINNPTLYNTTVDGLAEGFSMFTWEVTNANCTETDGMVVNNNVVSANAGEDMSSCEDNAYTMAEYPMPGTGTWSVIQGGGTFSILTEPSVEVTNIPPGENIYRWTVVADGITVFDDVSVFNNTPEISAGGDFTLLTSQIGNLITTGTLNASSLEDGNTGTWTVIAGGSVLSDYNVENPNVTGLIHGENTFQWEVVSGECTAVDEMTITSGYIITSAPGDGVLDWEDASDWDVNTVPAAGDSVTIFGCEAILAGGTGECAQLVIGSGSSFIVEGTARAAAVFRTGSLVIEQSAERFPNVRGVASMGVYGDASIMIDGDMVRSNRAVTNKGLRIGSGGSLVIEQSAERGTTRGLASLYIGSGRSLVIEQSAERSTNAVANASLRIGSGGSLVIEQSAERGIRSVSDLPAIKVGGGGELLIINNNIANPPASLRLGENNSILVASETGETRANAILRGGSLVIEQSAERNNRARSNANLTIGRGGSLVIEQSAERGESSVHVPSMAISNGSVTVGLPGIDRDRAAATGLYTRSLVIEQSAERSVSDEINLTVNGNGGLYIEPGAFFSNFPEISLKKGATVTFEEGAEINLFDDTFFSNANFILEKGSSLIDMNENSDISAEQRFELEVENLHYVSSAFSDANIDNFMNIGDAAQWEEANVNWGSLAFSTPMSTMKGYGLMPIYSSNTSLYGTLNTGYQQMQLTNDGSVDLDVQGWNLAGNPFPSALDLETMNFAGINNTVYFYDPAILNYKLYQLGGISTNGATQFAMPGEGFFVKTESYFMLEADNSNRKHFVEGSQVPVSRDFSKVLKLRASGNGHSDEAVVHFTETATEDYDNIFDAFKKFAYHDEVPQLYTVAGSGETYAINTLPFSNENTTSVELSFESGVTGSYTISAEELKFNADVDVHLTDNLEGNTINLRTTPTYTFDYTDGDQANRFTILFGSGINSVETKVANAVEIFASNKNIFVKTDDTDEMQISVYNVSGAIVYSTKSNGTVTKIQSNLPSGVYIVKAVSEKGASTQKVVLD